MTADIIDNRNIRLVDRIGGLLTTASCARFAVGYLFLDGLTTLQSHLQRLDEVRFLIGNVVNRVSEDELKAQLPALLRGGEDWVRDQEDVAATLRGVRDRSATETALNLRRTLGELPPTEEARKLLLTMAARVADGGLKVRLYTRGRIHAKLVIIDYPKSVHQRSSIAVVGSSNVTLGGEGQPTELNVVVDNAASVRELSEWYESLWDVSQDFHRELFDELGNSWAMEPGG